MHSTIGSAKWSMGLLILVGLPAFAANHTVDVGGSFGLAFEPSRLFIQAGDTVTFRNLGGFHNVVSDAARFRCADGCDNDGANGNGNASIQSWQATRTFNSVGAFDIYCEPHGAPGFGMSGVITVEPATALSTAYTGTWYDPAQSGHGFFVEVLPGDLLLAYWFTFSPDGQQAWFGGVGQIVGNTASVPATQSTGARFIPNFSPTEVVRTAWGTLNFSFSDCTTGRVDFQSVLGFGSGSMNLKRLTTPAGLQCSTASASNAGTAK
jgi:plastocyanin